ncbi:MAG: hypothetical protein ACK5MY_02470 [Jhaorihella sp.]
MQLGTIEQLVRIVAYMVGSYLLGEGVADSEIYQTAIGGIVNVVSFLWWLVRERQTKSAA